MRPDSGYCNTSPTLRMHGTPSAAPTMSCIAEGVCRLLWTGATDISRRSPKSRRHFSMRPSIGPRPNVVTSSRRIAADERRTRRLRRIVAVLVVVVLAAVGGVGTTIVQRRARRARNTSRGRTRTRVRSDRRSRDRSRTRRDPCRCRRAPGGRRRRVHEGGRRRVATPSVECLSARRSRLRIRWARRLEPGGRPCRIGRCRRFRHRPAAHVVRNRRPPDPRPRRRHDGTGIQR